MNDTVYFVDHSAVRASNATWNWSFPGGSPSTSNLEDPIIVYNQAGTYDVSLTVSDQFGTSSQTLSDFIIYNDTTSAITSSTNYKQDFESMTFPPSAWQTPNSSFSWQSIIVDSGSNCLPNKVTYVDHYHISQRGDEAFLISNKVKLGNGPSAINYLTYDYSYSGFSSAHDDGFRIDISNDCGHSWDSIYGAFGADLATTSYQSSVWFPTCDSWQTDTINLSSLGYNNDTIMLRFVAINDYGNQFYLDNININGDNIISTKNIENNSLRLYPNPSNGSFSVLSKDNNLDYEIFDLMGKSIKKGKLLKNEKTINLAAEKPGIYLAIFKSSYTTITKKFTIY